MHIQKFSAKHGSMLSSARIGEVLLSDAAVVQKTLTPIVEHQRLEGITVVAAREVELVLLSIGKSVLGVVTGENGFLAVDAHIKRSGQHEHMRLAAAREPSALLSVETLDVISREPKGTEVETERSADASFEQHVLQRFQPVSAVRPSFWTENRVMVYGNRSPEDQESLSIRVARGLPLGIFALSAENAILFTAHEGLLPNGENINQAHIIPTHIERVDV